jgi:hypothetical protein
MYSMIEVSRVYSMRALCVALLLALPCYAQNFYYQSIMPDGRVVVGDKPAPGAKEVRQIQVRPGNTTVPLAPPLSSLPSPEGGASPSRPPGDDIPDSATAQENLRKARAALEAGQEPKPGERIGTVGGKSRLTPEYFGRIKSLEQAVVEAQKEADSAARGSSR